MNSPLFLLLSTGLLLGLYAPIGKFVGVAGINPVLWAMVISLVPGLVLQLLAGQMRKDIIGFGLVSGLTAYVIPNSIVFAAIPHVGAGYAGLMFALSPIVTALLSLVLRVRPPDKKLLVAVAFGFAGACLIVLFRSTLTIGGDGPWPLIAFAIPVSLACGNVWRTARWPKGASALQVGAASNLGAIPSLALLLLSTASISEVSSLAHVPVLVVLQIGVSIFMFLVFFRLQQVGGPTYLSQIGYVAAAVGLATGVLLFGESYPWTVWLGAGLIGAGVIVSNLRK
jgi:drug/metabolite transporter (DMT)-like permease